MYVPTHLVVYRWAGSNVGLLSLVKCINLVEKKRVEVTAAAAKQASGPQISQSIQLNLSRAAGTLSFKQQTDAAEACSATANTLLLGLTKCFKELSLFFLFFLLWRWLFFLFLFFLTQPPSCPMVAFDQQKMNKARITSHSLSSTLWIFNEKEKKKKLTKDNYFHLDYLSQWLTFWKSKKWLILEP